MIVCLRCILTILNCEVGVACWRTVATKGRQVSVVLVQQKMARVIGHNECECEAAEVKQVLNRVHRQACKGFYVCVSVMKAVTIGVQGLQV